MESMIVGVGTDIVSLERFKTKLDQYNEALLNRLFTPIEQEKANHCHCELTKLGAYAKRFAAKEAFSKALGTGIGQNISWTDIEIVNNDQGAPQLRVSDNIKSYIYQLIPKGYKPIFHVSLSDEKMVALAFVVIEAVPAAQGN